MENDPKKLRQAAMNFAAEAYSKMKNNRSYAVTPETRAALGAFARAMFERRIAERRDGLDAKPTSWQEFFGIIERLAAAGANVLQERPGDAKPPPKPWLDPVTNEPLPNPWLIKNLKGQSILEKRDPDLAAHFKAMAADDYGTLAKMQDAQAARIALEQIPYSAAEHETNPFRTNDLAAQSAYVKNAPPGFVEFCKYEAKPVEIPIFGKNKDMTIEGQLAKDPATFALMKVAQQIHSQWNREDKAAAQAQRAEAEAALKRLESVAV
jgi:hypothetical protein